MKIWAVFCCWLKLQVEMLHLSVKFDGPFFLKALPLFNFHSGTPASTGIYNFVARVTDDNYARQEKEFSLTIGDTDYFFEGEAVFRLLAISRGTMKLELTPYDMPYTMVVDRDMDWLELTVYLYAEQEWVRINGASASSGAARTLSLYKGNNQITIGVSPDGYNFRRFILTVYRLP